MLRNRQSLGDFVILGCGAEIPAGSRVEVLMVQLRGGVAMEYRFLHFSGDCEVLRGHTFCADTDTAALELAWEIFKLTGSPEHGFELRQGDRHLFTHNC